VRRGLAHAVALVLGVAVGVASLAVHRDELGGFPAGLLLVAVTSVFVGWVLRRFSATGRVAAAYCVGWLAVLTYVLIGRPEGDFVIAADVDGYTLIGVGLVVVVLLVSALAGRSAGRGST